MKREHRGHGHSQEVAASRAAKRENPARKQEEQQRGGKMNREVRRMVDEWIASGEPVIEGEGEFGENPRTVECLHHRRQGEEVAEIAKTEIELNRARIVELNVAAESAGIDRERKQQHPGEGHQGWRSPRAIGLLVHRFHSPPPQESKQAKVPQQWTREAVGDARCFGSRCIRERARRTRTPPEAAAA